MQISIEHKKKYLDRRLSEIEELNNSLINEHFDLAINIGHRLKGNGKTFGHPAISSIGIAIEKAAIAKDKAELSLAIECLDNYIKENLKEIQS
jgi:HPt (histidine-containing phosphotransfer) domain-containing protein